MPPGQVNGQYHQHALIDLSSSAKQGAPFRHRMFSALSFSDEGEKVAVNDAKGEIVGYVIKPRKTGGKVKMKLNEWDQWRDWCYQQAALLSTQLQRPVGPGQVEITMTVSCGPSPSSQRTRRVRCMIQKDAFDSTDSQDPLEFEAELFVMDITDDQGRRFIERG